MYDPAYDVLAARVMNLIIDGLDKNAAISEIVTKFSNSNMTVSRDILESHYLLKLFN